MPWALDVAKQYGLHGAAFFTQMCAAVESMSKVYPVLTIGPTVPSIYLDKPIDDVSGIVNREEIESCIRQVMEGERGKEIKENAKKWRELALEAVGEGGTSDRNIDEFMSKLRRTA
ncbi:hypothetical protein QQP08_014886 [Theobroma cacao]|nr:hypothetical protein QQP08_014886 [Theobroma cacao]